MTEDDARSWVGERYPDRMDAIGRFVSSVLSENGRQNLISPATTGSIWARHIVDSLQLVEYAVDRQLGHWLDVGTGGGFPGLVLAVVWPGPVTLVEPRRKRAEFLVQAASDLELSNVTVEARRVEQVHGRADVISARAVASIEALVVAASHVASAATRWILPRGTVTDVDEAQLRARKALFHVKQSITSSGSKIVIIDGVGRPA